MSKGRVTKQKHVALSDVGKQIANLKDEFGLAFDQIKNIIFQVAALDEWKQNDNVLFYRKLVVATNRNKDPSAKKDFIANFCTPWRKLFDTFHADILNEDLSFLTDNNIVMTTGRNKKAQLPLSEVYAYLLRNDESELASLEAYMFHIFMHLVDEKKEAEYRETLKKICEQYGVEEDESSKNAVANICKTVKGSLGDLEGKQPTLESITPIVKALIDGDGGMGGSMQTLAENLLNGKTDIPSLVGAVKQSFEADQAKQKGNNNNVPALEEADSEETE